MECNLKCVVRYDGTNFAGWQTQPGQRTVQGTLETALSTIADRPIRIQGAGRTDAGVHALGQVFSCRWPGRQSPGQLRRSLSSMLGPEMRLESIEVVAGDFHAGYSAIGKRYAYALCSAKEPDPFSARYAWCVPWEIDWACLARAAQRVVGEHDFAGFRASGASSKTTLRTLYSVDLHQGGVVGPLQDDALWRVEFHGDGFLYKMVRNLVGTFVDIARGATSEERLDELFDSPGPFQGRTAPPHGLFLMEVLY